MVKVEFVDTFSILVSWLADIRVASLLLSTSSGWLKAGWVVCLPGRK
jgi:hypothetical protein